jgi:hypothetical protein
MANERGEPAGAETGSVDDGWPRVVTEDLPIAEQDPDPVSNHQTAATTDVGGEFQEGMAAPGDTGLAGAGASSNAEGSDRTSPE